MLSVISSLFFVLFSSLPLPYFLGRPAMYSILVNVNASSVIYFRPRNYFPRNGVIRRNRIWANVELRRAPPPPNPNLKPNLYLPSTVGAIGTEVFHYSVPDLGGVPGGLGPGCGIRNRDTYATNTDHHS